MYFGFAESNPKQRTYWAQNTVVSALKEGVLGVFAVVGQFLLGREDFAGICVYKLLYFLKLKRYGCRYGLFGEGFFWRSGSIGLIMCSSSGS